MPNKHEVGYADDVLYDDMHKPMAVIEGKRMCVDPSKGGQQVKLCADIYDDLKNYKAKAECYIRQYQDHLVIAKLKKNVPLTPLDARQIYFVNQIVEYVVHNSMLKDMAVLRGSPFTDRGSVVEGFPDISIWQGIRAVCKQINANASIA